MFIVMNDLPLPGLNDVMMSERLSVSFVMNSMLVRSILKASFMLLRFPFSTTTFNFSPLCLRQGSRRFLR